MFDHEMREVAGEGQYGGFYALPDEDVLRVWAAGVEASPLGRLLAEAAGSEVDRAGRVSKCGDGMVRGLLFEAAKVLLSRSARPARCKAGDERSPRASGATFGWPTSRTR